MGTGIEPNQRTHFDEVVETYDKIRPDYPANIYTDIFNYLGTNTNIKALEIGAGTGKATAPFLRSGCDVTAIEIGTNMAEFLRSRFKDYRHFNLIVSAFEDATLAEDNFDLIYAATAFHWVDAQIGCPKVLKHLKRNGVFALFRYLPIPGDGDSLYEEIQAYYDKYFHQPNIRPIKKAVKEFMKPSELKRAFGFEDLKLYGFTDVTVNLYQAPKVFSADEYIAMLETFPDHKNLPDSDRSALFTGVKEAITKHGGYFKIDYVFLLYMGRKA